MAEMYIKGLSSSKSPASRQGSAAALRVLPYQLLMPCWHEAISALGQACQVCCMTVLYPGHHCCSAFLPYHSLWCFGWKTILT